MAMAGWIWPSALGATIALRCSCTGSSRMAASRNSRVGRGAGCLNWSIAVGLRRSLRCWTSTTTACWTCSGPSRTRCECGAREVVRRTWLAMRLACAILPVADVCALWPTVEPIALSASPIFSLPRLRSRQSSQAGRARHVVAQTRATEAAYAQAGASVRTIVRRASRVVGSSRSETAHALAQTTPSKARRARVPAARERRRSPVCSRMLASASRASRGLLARMARHARCALSGGIRGAGRRSASVVPLGGQHPSQAQV
mmetsp:Transcript_81463/g.204994  ORF Transcript_81463/g.204994 Transcript_81463/m.204994 type:complete len:259 (-) Transcript_81463:1133-1909(-)